MEGAPWRLVSFVLRATGRLQVPLVLFSLLTLPAAWFLLDIPKHIINHALADASEHGGMTFFGFHLSRIWLLIALCASYLVVLTMSGLAKYAANRARGRINERLVRRLRLRIARRARTEKGSDRRSALAAVAVQEVEPIGYFGSSLAVVPLIHGGTLLISVLFLFLQNPALALSALIMLPVQLGLLPRLQRRLNAKVRERVYATRTLSGLLMTSTGIDAAAAERIIDSRPQSALRRQALQVETLERVRIEIHDLKGRLKGLYNYTSNLTPFFFFAIGGYLVVKESLSLGALVAALAAYREIAPALRELFDFAQNWSDARARFEEVTKVLANSTPNIR
ncbi:MAG: multidrug ABC transporter ATPase [Beijerinckiaceae bacterium]|nr:multidrug ABC transporter ATPase [Beijerinckiaceae bacterium]